MAGEPELMVADFGSFQVNEWRQTLNFAPYSRVEEAGAGRNRKRVNFYAMKSEVCPNVVHVGERAKEECGRDFAVVVRNKSTGHVSVSPVSLLRFAPRYVQDPEVYLGLKREERVDKTKNILMKEREQFGEKRQHLVEEFGTKRKQRVLTLKKKTQDPNINESNATLLGSLVPDINEVAAKDKEESEAGGSGLAETTSQVLPARNPAAKSADQIYRLEQFLSEEDVEAMGLAVDTFLEPTAEQLMREGANRFVVSLRGSLPMDQTQRRKKAAALLLLDAIMKMVKIPKAAKRTKAKGVAPIYCNEIAQTNIPEEVAAWSGSVVRNPVQVMSVVRIAYLGAAFRSRGGGMRYELTQTSEDKMIAHSLCLALILNGQKVNLVDLEKSTLIPLARLRKMAQSLGCLPDSSDPNVLVLSDRNPGSFRFGSARGKRGRR